MNRYQQPIDLFIKILTFNSPSEQHYTPDTLLGDIVTEEFDGICWLNSLLALQIALDVDIPDELADRKDISIGEFVKLADDLPRTNDELFPARVITSQSNILEQALSTHLERITGNRFSELS